MNRKVGSILPGVVKEVYRYVRYANQRKKVRREIFIRREQDRLLSANYPPDTQKLVVFVVPGADWSTGNDTISGGVMSIVSICEETASLEGLHGAKVIMVTQNQDHLFLKHKNFQNDTLVYRFAQLHRYFTHLSELIIHIPEFSADHFLTTLSKNERKWLASRSKVHVNVMNQNIRLMPAKDIISAYRSMFSFVTITTAHQRYCTPAYREEYGVPLHKLSVWISPEQYKFLPWHAKRNLMVISPDPHPLKDTILKEVTEKAGVEAQIISGLTYEAYKELISTAKWSLTFGEGLDGYFIEPVFCGAISFAIYNEQFFTDDFGGLETVYSSVEELVERITDNIRRLDNESAFSEYQGMEFGLCAAHYSKEQYRKNIAAFYKQQYTYA